MNKRIKRVGVLGSGVMGTGIAAHLAGTGLDVLLLDIVPPNLSPAEQMQEKARNRFALSNLDRALESKPPVFHHPEDRRKIRVGNFDDHFNQLGDCDWIIEVVVENMAIKRALFEKVEQVRQPGSLITSNTSGLSINAMCEGRSDDFTRNFLVTHFFNPVRFMRLLELVSGEKTDPAVMAFMKSFGADRLGKGIVIGKDTPNFVANRIGIFSVMYILHKMVEASLTLEEIDAVFGVASGRPKSAVFRTADLVGLDTLVHVTDNCYQNLPHDEQRDVFKVPAFLRSMIERKWFGQKTKGGFYKKQGEEILALDINTLEYRAKQKVTAASIGATKGIDDPGKRIKTLINGSDKLAKLAWDCTAKVLAYSAQRIGEITDDIVNCDNAMKWGFNWDLGPFETWDAIGVPQSLERMAQDGIAVPNWVTEMVKRGKTSFYGGTVSQPTYYDLSSKKEQPQAIDTRHIRLRALAEQNKIVKKNSGATLYDAGDGVLLVEFHTKMNAVDDAIIGMLNHAIELAENEGWRGIVVGNEHTQAFSAGANLFAIVVLINNKDWKSIDQVVRAFQQINMRMRYCDVPVVAAPAGLALGGGAEIVMSADMVRSHAELYMGLVEFGVGLIPAGGGALRMLERWLAHAPDDPAFDTMPLIKEAFTAIGMAKVSIGAEDARRLGMLRDCDSVTLNRDLLLHDAKQLVLGMSNAGYRPSRPPTFRLPGADGAATIRWFADGMRSGKQITDYEYKMASKLAWILCGGQTTTRNKVTHDQILDLEREAFLSLCGEAKTQERLQHFLMKNKPLRN